MIVTTDFGSATVILGPDGSKVRVRGLARREMLASACESFDHLRLGPGARHSFAGRTDTETVWYVLRGPLLVGEVADRPEHLAAEGDLVLTRRGHSLRLQAGPLGAEVLRLTLAARRRVPARRTAAHRAAPGRTRP
ncbi:hypothetical protein ACWEQL_06400 [Kitasatospora sp. NPDC004240]